MSDAEGRFHFRDLPSGKWTLSISDYYLPSDHYLEQQSAEIELAARVGKEVLVSVFPNRRNFQIIDEARRTVRSSISLNECNTIGTLIGVLGNLCAATRTVTKV